MSEVFLRAVVESRGVDVEFAVAAGEVLAVLGPNGAGKSTALHVIAGLVRPDNGVVRVGERMLTDTSTGIDVRDPRPPRRPAAAGSVAVPAPGRRGQRGVRPAQPARLSSTARPRRFPGGGGALAGSGRCRRPGRSHAAPAVRRTGAAGRAGPRAGRRTRRVAVRRTSGRPGRGRGNRDAQGVARRAGPRRPVGGADHSRSARRAHAGRPRADPGIRQDRRNRFGRSGIGGSAQPLRGEVRRREPGQRYGRRRRGAHHGVGDGVARHPGRRRRGG